MSKTRVSLIEVEKFLKRELPPKLRSDIRRLNIVKEGDLECCVYYHLRKYLHTDKSWRVFARRLCYHTGHYIDILIFREKRRHEDRRQIPRIAIELKWNKKAISQKDRKSLGKSLKRLRVNKAYFITTLIGPVKYTKMAKKEHEKYALHELAIRFNPEEEKLKKWKANREKFRKKMIIGKGGKG
jgi:hypothetical protein